MSYMILTYGSYDIPKGKYEINTKEEAMNILHNKIKRWCNKHNLNMIEDTDYHELDDVFIYGEEEKGVCIIAIYHVPKLPTEADDCLWDAKIAMEQAYFASEDYKYTLMESEVGYYSMKAQEYIDRAVELMGGWEYEED